VEEELIIYKFGGRYYTTNCCILGITFKDDVAQLLIEDEFGEKQELPVESVYFNPRQLPNKK